MINPIDRRAFEMLLASTLDKWTVVSPFKGTVSPISIFMSNDSTIEFMLSRAGGKTNC